jgi:uncharacterized paraquat-inducible protein A
MKCTRCGNETSDGAVSCANCGAPVAANTRPGQRPAEAPSPAGGAAAYSFDASRWTLSDRIAAGATLIVLVSLFLPWFSINLAGLGSLGVTSGGIVTVSGTDAHGWLWLVFVVGLLLLLYLVIVVGFQAVRVILPVKHERLLLAVAGLNFLLVLIGFAVKPGNGGYAAVKFGWAFGAIVALIAAAVAVVPLARAAYSEMNTVTVGQTSD